MERLPFEWHPLTYLLNKNTHQPVEQETYTTSINMTTTLQHLAQQPHAIRPTSVVKRPCPNPNCPTCDVEDNNTTSPFRLPALLPPLRITAHQRQNVAQGSVAPSDVFAHPQLIQTELSMYDTTL